MAMSKTIILTSQQSDFSNSCHVTSLNREYFPKCGKKYVVLQGNNRWKIAFFFFILQQHRFSLDQLRSLCTSQKRLSSGSSRIVGSQTCLQAIWPHLIAFEECCWACLTRSPRQAALAGSAPGGLRRMDASLLQDTAFPQKRVAGFSLYTYFTAL